MSSHLGPFVSETIAFFNLFPLELLKLAHLNLNPSTAKYLMNATKKFPQVVSQMQLQTWIQSIDDNINNGQMLLNLLPMSSSKLPAEISHKFPLLNTQNQLLQCYSTYLMDKSSMNINKLLNYYTQQLPIYQTNMDKFTRSLLKEAVNISKAQDYKENNQDSRKLIKDCLNRMLTAAIKQNPSWSGILFTTNAILELVIDLDAIDQGLHVINGQVERFADIKNCVASDQVKYWYYCGRAYFDTHDFKNCDSFLTKAWSKCNSKMIAKKTIILKYLLVCRLVRGCVPNEALLDKYGMTKFRRLLLLWKAGNLNAYISYIDEIQDWLIDNQLYTILKFRTPLLLYRNFFKQM